MLPLTEFIYVQCLWCLYGGVYGVCGVRGVCGVCGVCPWWRTLCGCCCGDTARLTAPLTRAFYR